jgi:hypothetical protein
MARRGIYSLWGPLAFTKLDADCRSYRRDRCLKRLVEDAAVGTSRCGLAGRSKADIFASMSEKQHPAQKSSTTGYSFRIERNGVAEIWDVAIDNLKDAEAKLRKQFDSDIQILSSGELTKAHVAQLGLEPGQAKKSP